MAELLTNKALSGTTGEVWFDGEKLANLKKADLKVEGNFEDLQVCGDYRTFPNYLGYSITGSVTLAKIDSLVLKKYATAYKTGDIPTLKIIAKLTDKSTGKVERTAISGAVLTTLTLANFEAAKLIDEEIPVKASDYDVLETI